MAQTIAGETGTLAGYNLNVICTATPGNEYTSQSQDYNVSMTITDNLNSLSIWKSYGFNVNNSATLGPFSTL